MQGFTEASWREMARETIREWWVGSDHELEVDPDAAVHVNEEEGYAWVQAWIFVPDPQIGAEIEALLAELPARTSTEDVHVRPWAVRSGTPSLWRRLARRFGLRSW